MPTKPAIAAVQRARRTLAQHRHRQHDGEYRREKAHRRTFGERQEAQRAEEGGRGHDETKGAHELQAQVARAPEAAAASMPGDRHDDEHLARVARPDDEEKGVVANEVLRRRVERAEEQPREEEER